MASWAVVREPWAARSRLPIARVSGRQMVAPVVRLGICGALITHSPL